MNKYKNVFVILKFIFCAILSKASYAQNVDADKMALWQRGINAMYDEDEISFHAILARRLAPIRKARSGCSELDGCGSDFYFGAGIRGGDIDSIDDRLLVLESKFGPEFKQAIEQNIREHEADCRKSCESFFCADENDVNSFMQWDPNGINSTEFVSFPFGAVPPEDFASDFGFPLDLIKVSQGALFPEEEAAEVVRIAESEGLSNNEYKSGKYKLGGDWLLNLPETRAWFNGKLKTTFFPILSHLFPEIVSSPSVLRAHSVSLLKYNASHPRTDVHIDNGILAMTLAMTPMDQYKGGGTYFEHLGDNFVLPMDVGYGTFRPGSVRHGGHKVTGGVRYILGAFLLISNRVEHVRRLKNRGSDFRKSGDLDAAKRHFEWALAINPKCTTCMKDLGEVLLTQKNFDDAEKQIRTALALLEGKDSDALFTLGLILSELGRDEESIEAYTRSIAINAEDAELCYNLGIKLGAKGDYVKERQMYERAVSIRPSMGGAWINWGTSLAESAMYDEAEQKFLQVISNSPELAPKAMINLSLIYQTKAKNELQAGKVQQARDAASEASNWLIGVKEWLDAGHSLENIDRNDLEGYQQQYNPLRLQSHRLSGQIMAAMSDFDACEEEFRSAVENFPNDAMAWDMLSRILDLQGKSEEAATAKQKMNILKSFAGSFL